jgi:hypothetical protein
MLQAQDLPEVDVSRWTTFLPVAVGAGVALLVFVFFYWRSSRRRRRRLAVGLSTEEELPWDNLLELLRARNLELAASGAVMEDDVSPEELLKILMARLPVRATGVPPPERETEELQFLDAGGVEQRRGRRRWGNPTEVYVSSPVLPRRLHGLVINRSTGGLAIFVDMELQPGTTASVVPVEAPAYIQGVEVEVRHCRKVGKNFMLGCQFRSGIPWNVRVWFG